MFIPVGFIITPQIEAICALFSFLTSIQVLTGAPFGDLEKKFIKEFNPTVNIDLLNTQKEIESCIMDTIKRIGKDKQYNECYHDFNYTFLSEQVFPLFADDTIQANYVGRIDPKSVEDETMKKLKEKNITNIACLSFEFETFDGEKKYHCFALVYDGVDYKALDPNTQNPRDLSSMLAEYHALYFGDGVYFVRA